MSFCICVGGLLKALRLHMGVLSNYAEKTSYGLKVKFESAEFVGWFFYKSQYEDKSQSFGVVLK